MEMHDFRHDMKRLGKKPHVIDGLVYSVEQFASYLQERNSSLDRATLEDIDAFFNVLETQRQGLGREVIRGVALYFDFMQLPEIAQHAWRKREQSIAKKRRIFSLKAFRGVHPGYIVKLAAQGILNVNQMLDVGRTPAARAELAATTGIPLAVIVEYVKLSDLTRIGALKQVRARLYYDAGLDTIDKIAGADPQTLCENFIRYIDETGFDGIAPLPKEIRNAVAAAQQIERLVEY